MHIITLPTYYGPQRVVPLIHLCKRVKSNLQAVVREAELKHISVALHLYPGQLEVVEGTLHHRQALQQPVSLFLAVVDETVSGGGLGAQDHPSLLPTLRMY